MSEFLNLSLDYWGTRAILLLIGVVLLLLIALIMQAVWTVHRSKE